MNDTTYNGWSNYATWRINLECVDGFDPRDHGFGGVKTDDTDEVYDFAEYLKQYVEECLFAYTDNKPSLVEDYARAFLLDVNWHEIAKHLIADYADEVTA
jgi:hypothetical protein